MALIANNILDLGFMQNFIQTQFNATHLSGQFLSTNRFTRLAGIPFQPLAHSKLIRLYEKIFRLTNKLPASYPYKLYTEDLICRRMEIVKLYGEKHYKIEELCDAKIERMISLAESEFYLVRKLLDSKAWEPLRERAPPGQWEWPPIIK